ncbi:hypothetical protein CYY_001413 [Polysphondylium violaceum]|uniref:Uncharacterized protein n=1 Tax=Polysphondylium violaceum TaxID=133409 RepID=A0A8J4PZW4_9MYCE|nr:hypothetical protein CYY_001413 [Polysphondylium violaceum]
MKDKENDIILTDKQRKRELSFTFSLANKRLKANNSGGSGNDSLLSSTKSLKSSQQQQQQQLSEKQIKKRDKRKWKRGIPKSNVCCFDPSSSSLSSSSIAVDPNSKDKVFIQCKGSTKYSLQCLRPVSKESVFCKQHLTPFYQSYILQLKEKGLTIDEIINHDAWRWNINSNNKTNKTKEHSIEALEFKDQVSNDDSNNNNNSIESPSLEFTNNSQKRLDHQREQRIKRQKELNQILSKKNDNSQKKKKKKKKKKNKEYPIISKSARSKRISTNSFTKTKYIYFSKSATNNNTLDHQINLIDNGNNIIDHKSTIFPQHHQQQQQQLQQNIEPCKSFLSQLSLKCSNNGTVENSIFYNHLQNISHNNSNNSQCTLSSIVSYCCFIQKKIIGYCWSDKNSCRKWKLTISLVCWKFHSYISEFCSRELDLDITESMLKNIDVLNHYKSKYSLFQLPPVKLRFSTQVFHQMCEKYKLIKNNNNNMVNNDNCGFSEFFSRLETLDLDYDSRYPLSLDHINLIFSNRCLVSNISIQFNGKCDGPSIYCLLQYIDDLPNIKSLSLLDLVEEHGSSINEASTANLDTTMSDISPRNHHQNDDYSTLELCPIRTLLNPSCASQSVCCKTIESIHFESLSVLFYKDLICSIQNNRFSNLKSLSIVYDDVEFFKQIPFKEFALALSKLVKLEHLCLSLSIVLSQYEFDIKWFLYYLTQENSLININLDWISDDINRVYSKEFINYIFNCKEKLQKLTINTPIISEIKSTSKLVSLNLTFESHITPCTIESLVRDLLNPNSNLKKLGIFNTGLYINRLLTRIITVGTKLKTIRSYAYCKDFNLVLQALASNHSLEKLHLTSDSYCELNKNMIESLLDTIEFHPSILKLKIESKFHTLSPKFYHSQFPFNIFFDHLTVQFIIIKKPNKIYNYDV